MNCVHTLLWGRELNTDVDYVAVLLLLLLEKDLCSVLLRLPLLRLQVEVID